MPAKPKPYDWTQFRLKILIAAPPSKLFAAWTNDRIVSKWFTVKTVIEPKKNGRIYFEWLGGDEMEAKVLGMTENRRFHFPFGKHNEQVEISIKKAPGGSVCELHQFNIRTTPKDKVAMHMGCKEGWTFFLTNLKSFLEHGIDLRSHDPKRCYRQGYVNS